MFIPYTFSAKDERNFLLSIQMIIERSFILTSKKYPFTRSMLNEHSIIVKVYFYQREHVFYTMELTCTDLTICSL